MNGADIVCIGAAYCLGSFPPASRLTLLIAGLPLALKALVKVVTIRVSLLSAVLAFVFSCAVTVVFGVVPAVRASKLDPTEALRHE